VFISFFSELTYFSLKSSLVYFRFGIFSLAIWYLIDKNKDFINNFFIFFLIAFFIGIFDGYYQFFYGNGIFGIQSLNSDRLSLVLNDRMLLGNYLSRLFPLLFALFLIKKKKRFEIYFIGLLFVLVDILIYLSGERTAFFYLNISTIFIIILIKEYQKFRLFTFILGIILISILSLNSPNLSDRMFISPAKDMGLIKSAKQPTIFTPVHDSHLRTAFNMFKDKPILGHGPKMFRIKCFDPKYSAGVRACSNHPHNFYAQLLAETGIIGFISLFSFLCYVIYCSYRQLKSILLKQKRFLTDYQVCLLAGLMITVWPLSPNGNFFNNWLMIVYSLPLGFYLQSIYSKKNLIR
jgi:hypothetical protein